MRAFLREIAAKQYERLVMHLEVGSPLRLSMMQQVKVGKFEVIAAPLVECCVAGALSNSDEVFDLGNSSELIERAADLAFVAQYTARLLRGRGAFELYKKAGIFTEVDDIFADDTEPVKADFAEVFTNDFVSEGYLESLSGAPFIDAAAILGGAAMFLGREHAPKATREIIARSTQLPLYARVSKDDSEILNSMLGMPYFLGHAFSMGVHDQEPAVNYSRSAMHLISDASQTEPPSGCPAAHLVTADNVSIFSAAWIEMQRVLLRGDVTVRPNRPLRPNSHLKHRALVDGLYAKVSFV